MNWDLYLRLSALMALEYAVWGAWMSVLAVRLLGPLKMTGKQTGWIYATLPLACIFAPLASGYLADSRFNAEWIILVSHAVGAILLFVAARQTKFGGMFLTMLLYSIFYTATLPLVNKMVFSQLHSEATWIFLWAPVAWALIGYLLTGIRQVRKTGGDGPDSLYLAGILSLVMVVVCFFQMPLKPASEGNPMIEALAMLKNNSYLIFILVQLVVSGMMQFYFLGTGRFLQDRGVKGKNVSAVMALAQAVQAVATIVLLDWLIGLSKVLGYGEYEGYRWIFIVGALCWTFLYITYVVSKRALWVMLIQAFHGLAYVFFMIGGQMFVGKMAPEAIGASAQSLIFIATNGIGLFLGTQLAGLVMQRNSVGEKFQWTKIWSVPLAITLGGAIAFAILFRVPSPDDFKKDNVAPNIEKLTDDDALSKNLGLSLRPLDASRRSATFRSCRDSHACNSTGPCIT
ncbi:MAG: MFS transporter [Planctomycetes bacterium]|nr:MFS transporter [Planctomycetota bacterium]MCG2682754.1 MFS transporter [Planctomycetales bacterium]